MAVFAPGAAESHLRGARSRGPGAHSFHDSHRAPGDSRHGLQL